MAIASKMFGKALMSMIQKKVDWQNDTIKVALYTGTLPGTAQDNWQFKSDVATITEITGTGYTAGGAALTANSTRTPGYDSASNTVKLDADDVTWSNSSISAAYALIYTDTGTAATSPLWGYIDFGQTFTSSAGDFKITWDAAGIFTLNTPA
jgi:hypothetical protein